MAIEDQGSAPVVDLTEKIHEVRGLRIILDSDIAAIYGVTIKRLREQVRRNRNRFPAEFVFVLTRQELANLTPQNAASSFRRHGGSAGQKMAFTEYGAIMAATVLNSDRAVEMSVFVVRAFVRMRELLMTNAALAKKLDELDERVSSHDGSISEILDAIRELINTGDESKPKREIGFHVKNSRTALKEFN